MRRPLGEEMDLYMERNRAGNVHELREIFNRTIAACEQLWGTHAFHKPTQGGWRAQLISPLYDAQMVAASLMTSRQLEGARNARERVIRATRTLFDSDPEFVKSVTQSTNNASCVRKRVTAIVELLGDSLNR